LLYLAIDAGVISQEGYDRVAAVLQYGERTCSGHKSAADARLQILSACASVTSQRGCDHACPAKPEGRSMGRGTTRKACSV